MIQAIVAVIAVCALALMSMRANRRFKEQDRLPMQWSLGGSVNWSAPRPAALAFTPILAAVILAAIAWLSTTQPPRPGQEGIAIPVLMFVALTFVGVHAFHLWLIRRSLRRSG